MTHNDTLKAGRRSVAFLAVFLIATSVGGNAALAATTVTWTEQIPRGPVPRIEDALVYDSVSNRVIMFGGYDLNWNRLNDIWEYDGVTRTWVDVTPATGSLPTRRSGHTMAFDPVRRVVILFGGLDDSHTHLGDTWEWNTVSKTWSNVTPAGTSPSVRQGARMVKDALNDRMVLVGGTNGNHFFPMPVNIFGGPPYDVTGTWAFNLSARTWSQLSPAQAPAGQFAGRAFPAVGYNSETNRVTLFGGIGFPAGTSEGTVLDFTDTWELQGNTWVRVATTGPGGRAWTHLVHDPDLHRMVMYGGWNNTGGFSWGDTWSLAAGGVWSQISTTSPGIRDSHGMVYDAARQKMVVFGGYLADVLELTGNTWSTAQRIDFPPGQNQHAMAYDSFRNVVFMYGGGSLESWELNIATGVWGWYYIPGPNGRAGAKVAYDQARRKMVLFGGRQRANGVVGSKLGDTWIYDAPTAGTRTWTNVTPATSPAARDDHAMAYDAVRGQTILFGGRDANGAVLGDTWVWTGSAWANVTAAGGPPARFGHAMAYDVARGVIVLFGGDNGARLNDVWEWNGSAWQQRIPAGASPPARAYPALSSLDASTPGVAMFGGVGTTQLNDTWVWDGTRWRIAAAVGGVPTPRERSAMVYNSTSQRLVLYGGHDSRGISTELWTAAIVVTAAPTDTPPGDFDGDGKSDVTVFRPSNGAWYVLQSSTNNTGSFHRIFGQPGDIPVPGDYDGDGLKDMAVFRPSNGAWYILQSSTNFTASFFRIWGLNGDIPVPGDYDGDGRTDIAVYRPGNGAWYILQSATNYTGSFFHIFGLAGDVPVPGDFDGDERTDIVVYRPGNGAWYVLQSSTNYTTSFFRIFGLSGDTPVQGDFDGDGRADIVVYRPSNGAWYILQSSTNFTGSFHRIWGMSGDTPAPGDFDGDGVTDIVVYRPSNGAWYILQSSTNFTGFVYYIWGLPGDIPVVKRP